MRLLVSYWTETIGSVSVWYSIVLTETVVCLTSLDNGDQNDNQPSKKNQAGMKRKIGKKAQNLSVSQSKEINYEPGIILGYIFRMGLLESGNSR
jgi:hypothetical protein